MVDNYEAGYDDPMAPRGMRPKPQGEARFRGQQMHGWIDVVSTQFVGGPDLPARRRGGGSWPEWIRERWEVWRSMPHARLWFDADWQYAIDTVELAAIAFHEEAKVGLLAELRFREKQMGTTWSARQDMRIRYVPPAAEPVLASVFAVDQFRDL
jgi:hypothetical protein